MLLHFVWHDESSLRLVIQHVLHRGERFLALSLEDVPRPRFGLGVLSRNWHDRHSVVVPEVVERRRVAVRLESWTRNRGKIGRCHSRWSSWGSKRGGKACRRLRITLHGLIGVGQPCWVNYQEVND